MYYQEYDYEREHAKHVFVAIIIYMVVFVGIIGLLAFSAESNMEAYKYMKYTFSDDKVAAKIADGGEVKKIVEDEKHRVISITIDDKNYIVDTVDGCSTIKSGSGTININKTSAVEQSRFIANNMFGKYRLDVNPNIVEQGDVLNYPDHIRFYQENKYIIWAIAIIVFIVLYIFAGIYGDY